MKKQIKYGVCVLASLLLLGEPIGVQASEQNGRNVAALDTEELLTAGIGDLFISELSKIEYVEIAREFLPDDFDMKELRAEYRKAAVMGDYLTPRISKTEEGYVTALCDSKEKPYAVIQMRG